MDFATFRLAVSQSSSLALKREHLNLSRFTFSHKWELKLQRKETDLEMLQDSRVFTSKNTRELIIGMTSL
jgi:hypothetical protein